MCMASHKYREEKGSMQMFVWDRASQEGAPPFALVSSMRLDLSLCMCIDVFAYVAPQLSTRVCICLYVCGRISSAKPKPTRRDRTRTRRKKLEEDSHSVVLSAQVYVHTFQPPRTSSRSFQSFPRDGLKASLLKQKNKNIQPTPLASLLAQVQIHADRTHARVSIQLREVAFLQTCNRVFR